MEGFYVIVFMVLLGIAIYLYSERERRQRLRLKIRESYGEIPKPDNRELKPITIYWEEYKEEFQDRIDEVTWNDLGFTSLFYRINICCSFVGEQILYAMLHRFPNKKEYGEKLERKIRFFTDHDEKRYQVQLLLAGLGKSDASYHIPTIIKKLDLFEMDRMKLYRMMQVLLLVSVLPAIILRNVQLLGITLIIFLINTILYVQTKTQYEIFLSAMGSLVNVITVANALSGEKKILEEAQIEEIKQMVKPFKK